MSPATNRHSRYQGLINRLLDRLLTDGEAVPKCSIQTTEGVKVADMVWASAAFLHRHSLENLFSAAPKLWWRFSLLRTHWRKWSRKKSCILLRVQRNSGFVRRMA